MGFGSRANTTAQSLRKAMVFEELPIVATETTVATKRLIHKETLARTAQKTAAKKKPAKKAAKKPKAKKAKKAKKPKAKKKKKKKKRAKKKKKRKKNNLNKGRNVKAVGKIFGGGSMFKLAGAIAKHMK